MAAAFCQATDPPMMDQTGNASRLKNVIKPSVVGQERLLDTVRRCHPCLVDETEELATSLCIHCIEYLCARCIRGHRKNKMTRRHKILKEKDIANDPTPFLKMKELMVCSEHCKSEVVYKCEDHDQFICMTCLAFAHRKCENVVELANCLVHSYDSLQKQFEMLQNEAIKNKAFCKRKEEILHVSEKNLEKERTEFTQMMIQQILKMDDRSKLETKKRVEDKCREIQVNLQQCEDVEEETISCLELSTIVTKYCSGEQLAVLSSHLLKKVDYLEKENEIFKERNLESLKFEKNSLLEGVETLGAVSFLKMTDSGSSNHDKLSFSNDKLSSDGETKVTHDISRASKSGAETTTETKNISLFQRKITSSSSAYSLRSPSDKRCCLITGFAKLNDKLVVIDKTNFNIKIFNADNNLFCSRNLTGVPLDVCLVGNAIAVVMNNIKLVKLYEVLDESLVKKRQFSTKYYPLSITAKKGWECYLLFSEQPYVARKPRQTLKLVLRNLSNSHVLNTFNLNDYMFFGGKSITNVCRVHYTRNGKIVISERQKLFIFMDDGTKLSLQRFCECCDISDIESDADGNIYICESDSKSIHQISECSYEESRYASCASAGSPSALFLDNEKSQIIVALSNEDRVWEIQFQKYLQNVV